MKYISSFTCLFLVCFLLFLSCDAKNTARYDLLTEQQLGNSQTMEEECDDTNMEATIVMAGDLLMHRFVQMSGERPDGSYCYDHLFENVKNEITSADIAIINQETVLAGSTYTLSGYPMFNAPEEVADAIAAVGFNVVLQATNHTLDKGIGGVRTCRKYWSSHYPEVSIVGTALSAEEASNICIIEVNGIRVAILNYTYGTNGIPLPGDMPYIVSLLEEERVRQDTMLARDIADFIVVCPHWGTEYEHFPSEEQLYWCRIFLECGVGLVIGTHPHVIQPVEWHSDGTHSMLVYYSVGNFVNSSAERGSGICDRMLGGMAKVTLKKDKEGSVFIGDACVIPLVTQLNEGYAGITVYPFSTYSDELATGNSLLRERDPVFSYAYCEKMFNDIFGDYMT